MKYASLKYDLSVNLGDEIQTLATEQLLPRVDVRVDRDSLASFQADEPHVVVFQGWFSMAPEDCFPPSEAIVPVFVGFHISRFQDSQAYFLSGGRLAYLKAHEPIGCRDEGTRLLLEGAGVRAYTTHCLTLTIPRRERQPKNGKVFIVDGDDLPIPFWLRRRAVHESHAIAAGLDERAKVDAAQQLLDRYRDQARLVITTKLHCALPCLAMGIPVVFFGESRDYRLSILHDLGVPIMRRNPRSWRVRKACHLRAVRWLWRVWKGLTLDWDPRPLDLEEKKDALRQIVRREVRRSTETAAGKEASSEELDGLSRSPG